jgi:AI-2 transport protein TqsA
VILGPMGAILAVPLTLFVHAILVGQDPDRLWAKALLAGTSGAAPTREGAAGRRSAWRRPRHQPGLSSAGSGALGGSVAPIRSTPRR